MLGFKSFAAASYLEQTYKLSVGEAFMDLKNAKDEFGNPIDPVAAKYAALGKLYEPTAKMKEMAAAGRKYYS